MIDHDEDMTVIIATTSIVFRVYVMTADNKLPHLLVSTTSYCIFLMITLLSLLGLIFIRNLFLLIELDMRNESISVDVVYCIIVLLI
jgi:hypothetical protein